MKKRPLPLTALLTAIAVSATVPAQQSANPAQWRTMLEKAVFARAYEGNPEATKHLFAQALAAAQASDDATATSEVMRQQANASPKQDPRAEQVIGRLLQSIAATTLAERQKKISGVDWEFYQRDPATARSLIKCFSGSVLVGDVVVDLRVEDVLRITDLIDTQHNVPILRAALTIKDPFVRTMAVRLCHQEEHLPLLLIALADANQLVREAACDNLPNETTPQIRAALLRALDLGTVGALEGAVDAPAFLTRMQKATHNSWLAKSMLEQQIEPTVEKWDANMVAKATILIEWAKAGGTSKHAARLTSLGYTWLTAERHLPGYPKVLARQCIELALGHANQLRELSAQTNAATAGMIARDLGALHDLVRLAPEWMLDERREDDCMSLFRMCKQLDEQHTERLIAIGVKLASILTKDNLSKRTLMLFQNYWGYLGSRTWTSAGEQHLQSALDTLATMPKEMRDAAYPQFVLGVQRTSGSSGTASMMERHYVEVATQRLVPVGSRIMLVNHLVGTGSKHGVEVAIALRGQWNIKQQRENYGDFLRRACGSAGENGKAAVLAAIRAGYTKRPRIVVGKQAAGAKRPRLTVLDTGRDGDISGWKLATPTANKVVTTPQDIVAELPSLLNVLSPDLTAAAVQELWTENSDLIKRKEMVEALLFARSSRFALQALVEHFDDITDTRTKADVLRVFGELLHTDARALIAQCLESQEPLLRHAALQAAELLLAYDRAKAGMAKDERRKK